MKRRELPEPECSLGYTPSQLETILGDRLQEFNLWMSGQTVSLCDGKSWNYEKMEYEPAGCGPHGPVVYSWDLTRFLDGLPIID